MGRDCRRWAPLLSRMAEGELSPDEAMRGAHHVSGCTPCRILLARERRLARMLEQGLDDPLHVGDEFVESVMARLPQEPPARVRRLRKAARRLLRLTGLAVLCASTLWLAAGRDPLPGDGRPARGLVAELDVPVNDGLLDAAWRAGGLVTQVAGSLAELAPAVPLRTLGLLGLCGAGAWVVVVAGLAGGAALLAHAPGGRASSRSA